MWLLLAACSPQPSGPSSSETGAPPSSSPTPTVPYVAVAASGLGWTLDEHIGSVVHTSWSQDGPATVHVEVQLDGEPWGPAPSFAATAGLQQQVVVGIPFATAAQWRVVVEGGATFDGDPITTGPIPPALPLPVLQTSDPGGWLPEGHYLLGSLKQQGPGWTESGPVDFWVFIVDRAGRPVWAQRTPHHDWTLFPQVSVTGDYLLWDEATYWSQFDDGAASVVHETWLDGEFGTISTPGVHQAWLQKPDGTLAWSSRHHGGTEALVEKAPGQPDETVLWDCEHDWAQGDGDSCHCNGLYYRASTDSYLMSYPLWGTVLEASATGGTLWWAGGPAGGFPFDPPYAGFSWEHGVSYTPAGTLLMSSNYGYTTWAMEYAVDPAEQVVRQVWGSDSGVRVNDMGQAWRLANGNTLHLVGDTGVIREVTADDVEVWRIVFPNQNLLGRGELIEDLYALVQPR